MPCGHFTVHQNFHVSFEARKICIKTGFYYEPKIVNIDHCEHDTLSFVFRRNKELIDSTVDDEMLDQLLKHSGIRLDVNRPELIKENSEGT